MRSRVLLPDDGVVTSKIWDAFVLLRIHSSSLSVEELTGIAGFKPTKTIVKDSRHCPRTMPSPANTVILSTGDLVQEKDLNAQIRGTRRACPQENLQLVCGYRCRYPSDSLLVDH